MNDHDDKVDASPFIIGRAKFDPEPEESETGHMYLLPVYEVDHEGSRQSPPRAPSCPITRGLANEIFEAFAWVEWVSVQRASDCFIVKVKHSYPIDVRPALRTWLGEHSLKKSGASFELQVKVIEP